MKIKICAVSDLHGHFPIIMEPADILLIAGDILPIEIQDDKPASKKWLENEFAEWIISLPVKQVFLVAGNHDFYFEFISAENISDLHKACRKLTYLCNETAYYYDSYGQLWSIFGTPYCHIFGNWSFMRPDEYMNEQFKAIPDKVDIIISHDPPYACGDCDVILETPHTRILNHLGNQPLRKRLGEIDYKFLVCGHIHSGDHTYNERWKTVNVSYLNEGYSPDYKPFYYELEK